MFEARIYHFPPVPDIDEDNPAVVGVPVPNHMAGVVMGVMHHGGYISCAPEGSMGPVTKVMVERGLEVMRHIAADLQLQQEIDNRRKRAGLN